MKLFDRKAREAIASAPAPAVAPRPLPAVRKHPAMREYPLITREDRLEWLRAVVNGEVFETRVRYGRDGERYEEVAEASVRDKLKCVELLAKIEKDFTEAPALTQTNVSYVFHDNARAALPPNGWIDTDAEVVSTGGQPDPLQSE